MRWEKLGRVFAADGQRPWIASHASLPFAEPLGGGLLRVYFSPRDRANRPHLGWLVIDIARPQEILELAPEPVLGPGAAGGFDRDGAMGSWLLEGGEARHLYYIGWQRRGDVPFRTAIGIAVDRGRGFEALGPVLKPGGADPLFVSTPCVHREGRAWCMWYASGLDWGRGGSMREARYDVRCADSGDGLLWQARAGVALGLRADGESAIARPCVVRDAEGYRMWYCYRGRVPYRIGYAVSADGLSWVRRDELAGIDVSDSGWDSEMVAYPFVFDHEGERYMLYCGNDFSRAGFGLARLVA